MKITVGKSKRRITASTNKDYASLKGMNFKDAKAILLKDGFKEHEYGDTKDNNGYAVYRKGNKEVELTYEWIRAKKAYDFSRAGKVLEVYVDEDINAACGGKKKSVKSAKTIKRRPIKAARLTMDFGSYKPWSGAVDTWDNLERFDRIDDLERVLDEVYYDEKAGEALLSETELNDLLWFEPETVYEWVGLFYNDETGDVSDEPFEEDIEESRKLRGKRAVKASEEDEDAFIDALWEACDDIPQLIDIGYEAKEGIIFIFNHTTPDYEAREADLIDALENSGYSAEYIANNGSNVIVLDVKDNSIKSACGKKKAVKANIASDDMLEDILHDKESTIQTWQRDYEGEPKTSWDTIFDNVLDEFIRYTEDEASAHIDENTGMPGDTIKELYDAGIIDSETVMYEFDDFLMWLDLSDYDF